MDGIFRETLEGRESWGNTWEDLTSFENLCWEEVGGFQTAGPGAVCPHLLPRCLRPTPGTLLNKSPKCYPCQGGARTTEGTGPHSLSPSPLQMSFPFHCEIQLAVCRSDRGIPQNRHLCARTGRGDFCSHTWLQDRSAGRDEVTLSHSLPHTPGSTILPPPPWASGLSRGARHGAEPPQTPPALSLWSQAGPLPHTPTALLLSTPAYPAAHFRQRSSP